MCWHSNVGRASFPGSNNKGCSGSKDICNNKCILENRLAMRTVSKNKTKMYPFSGQIYYWKDLLA